MSSQPDLHDDLDENWHSESPRPKSRHLFFFEATMLGNAHKFTELPTFHFPPKWESDFMFLFLLSEFSVFSLKISVQVRWKGKNKKK
jgi:hypothetical protein